ncbi:MAG: nucleotidyltransferase family protein [Candidatus Limnocylindria bacterium]
MLPQPHRIAAVILAAGASTRFGSPKQLAKVGERTMLEAVVEIAVAAGLAPILAVVPPRVPVPPQAVAVPNAEPQLGMSRSLQLGIGAIPSEVSAAVILLGDQPTLDPAVVGKLIAVRGDRPIIASSARGVAAPPVLLERARFASVDELEGDRGLRHLIRGADDVLLVEIDAHAPDIDTSDDLPRR